MIGVNRPEVAALGADDFCDSRDALLLRTRSGEVVRLSPSRTVILDCDPAGTLAFDALAEVRRRAGSALGVLSYPHPLHVSRVYAWVELMSADGMEFVLPIGIIRSLASGD
jgi:hypothetical protein